jgi:proline dehydrogenase
MSMTRRSILAVADNDLVTRFFRESRMARSLVNRFVAGETLDEAIGEITELRERGITATLDLLGENVTSVEASQDAVATYQTMLRTLRAEGLEPNASVKLTMLGLDFGDQVALDNMVAILDVAREVGGFVRIDMEGSAYTDVTMRIFEELYARYPEEVGIVIQTYLLRAEADVRRMIDLGARVRLVKGAYAEPASVAFQDKLSIDENYARLARLLLDDGNYPALATHDMNLVRSAIEHAHRHGIPGTSFEFQMLYGVRRDQQQKLVDDGWNMRVYVAFGTEWYPYFTRRIAERPANALFVLRQLRD